jgi:hypothetical protein
MSRLGVAGGDLSRKSTSPLMALVNHLSVTAAVDCITAMAECGATTR